MCICISKTIIIGSDDGFCPGRHEAIIWTNAGILWIGHLGINLSEILITIKTFSFKKMHLKMLSVKCRLSCLGLNETDLLHATSGHWHAMLKQQSKVNDWLNNASSCCTVYYLTCRRLTVKKKYYVKKITWEFSHIADFSNIFIQIFLKYILPFVYYGCNWQHVSIGLGTGLSHVCYQATPWTNTESSPMHISKVSCKKGPICHA